METALILGGSGLLGSNLSSQFSQKYKVITQGYSKNADFKCDLTKPEQVKDLLQKTSPQYIINTIAETSVERCEQEPVQAFNLNVLPVIHLKKALNDLKHSAHIVHVSTDHLYNNHFSSEEDLVFLNNYALTKYWAERELAGQSATVLRTNFFGGDTSFKLSFSGWAIKMLKSNEKFWGFDDVFFSPLHVDSFSEALDKVLKTKKPGVFNLGSSSELSKYDFIQKIANLKKLDGSRCSPISYTESKIKIPRPLNMSMNVSKFETSFKHKLPTLEKELEKI